MLSSSSEERYTETERVTQTQDTNSKKSRFKIRRSSFSHSVHNSTNKQAEPRRKMSTGKSDSATLFQQPSRIPTSLQTSPIISDKRFANVSRLPRLKNDSSGAKSRSHSREESSILSRSVDRSRLVTSMF